MNTAWNQSQIRQLTKSYGKIDVYILVGFEVLFQYLDIECDKTIVRVVGVLVIIGEVFYEGEHY
jgi:hypothetical protein